MILKSFNNLSVFSERDDIKDLCRNAIGHQFNLFAQNSAIFSKTATAPLIFKRPVIFDCTSLSIEGSVQQDIGSLMSLINQGLFIVPENCSEWLVNTLLSHNKPMIRLPCDPEIIKQKIFNFAKANRLTQTAHIQIEQKIPDALNRFIGNSWQSKFLRAEILEASLDSRPILLEGETGTGKTMLAKIIHEISPQSNGPFRPYNSATIQDSLFGSLLFGSTKGAYTGAEKSKGLLKETDGGILFLDELECLSLAIQGGLLTFLDEGHFYTLGSSEEQQSKVRLICATNVPTENLMKEKRLRLDFYNRISGNVIRIPPLGERPEDIIDITRFHLKELKADKIEFSDQAFDFLCQQEWKGNTRDLIKCIEKTVSKNPNGKIIKPMDLEF